MLLTILLIYLIGCILSYSVCKICRHVANAHDQVDKEITTLFTALSWISILIFIGSARKFYIQRKTNKNNQDEQL